MIDIENENEYRLSLSVQFYAEASRVASGYIYEWGDSLQLTKVMAKLADYILDEIMTASPQPATATHSKSNNRRVARTWHDRNNAISTGTWVAAFYDSLLYWEEKTGCQFLPFLNVGDARSLGKMFSYFSVDVRRDIVNKLTSLPMAETTPVNSMQSTVETSSSSTTATTQSTSSSSTTQSTSSPSSLQFFTSPRSKRMGPNGMILNALRKEKVSIGDMELAIIVESCDGGRRSRRARTRS
eukprot:13631319-Ditylum_brightwellii.AAC.1